MLARFAIALGTAVLLGGTSSGAPPDIPQSAGIYRLPYADGTRLSIFDDDLTHRPRGAVDLVGEPRGNRTHRVVAAAKGVVMVIDDRHSAQQSSRAAADCRNNYLWLSHANGEWTLYSHMAEGSSRTRAKLKVGDRVRAGQYLGDEAAIGCAMLSHLHFEVAAPRASVPIDSGGFLNDNGQRERMRIPRFCGVPDSRVRKGAFYSALRCR